MSNKKEKAKWEMILIKATVVSVIISSLKDIITTIISLINLFK